MYDDPMVRGLTILFAVILLLGFAAYVLYQRTPGLSVFMLTLSVLLAIFLILAAIGLIPTL